MTLAVCVKCGAKKLGALTWCPVCHFEPGDDPDNDDDLYSMILSDHYFSADDLERFSNGMQDGMPRPRLSVEEETKFRDSSRLARAQMANSLWGRLFKFFKPKS